MIKARAVDGTALFGLSRKNLEQLLDGNPIVLQLSEMGLPRQKIVILAGENEQAIMDDLVRHKLVAPDATLSTFKGDGFKPSREH